MPKVGELVRSTSGQWMARPPDLGKRHSVTCRPSYEPISREPALDLVQRSRTSPKGAAIFVATCLTREPSLINDYHAAGVTAEVLGIASSSELAKVAQELPPTGDGRAQVITLAVVLGALEARTGTSRRRVGVVRERRLLAQQIRTPPRRRRLLSPFRP